MSKARSSRKAAVSAVGPVLLALGIAAGCQSAGPQGEPGSSKPSERREEPAAAAPAGPAAPQGGAPAAAPAAQADGKTSFSPPGNPAPGEVLDKLGKDGSARATEEKAMAQHYYEIGKKLYDDLEYEKAYETLRKAVELDPTHASAVELYHSAGLIIGKREDELKGMLERYKREFEVKVELTRQEMVRFYESGEKKYNAGDYDGAIRDLERAREMIAWYPYKIDTAGYAEKADKLVSEAKRKKIDADLRRSEELEAQSLAKSREEERRRQKSEQRRVQTMLEQATDLLRARRYAEARDLATRVLEDDPQNPVAKKLREYAVLGVHTETNRGLFDRKSEEMWDDRMNMDLVGTPREGTYISFPEDWKDRTRDRHPGIAADEVKEPYWVTNYKKILKERKVTLNFPDVPLKDVVLFLQEITGLNFVIGPGVDPEERKISLRLKDIVLENALKIILEQTKLTYVFDKESIIITEPGQVKGDTYFEIYDVSDILFKIPDHPGPRLSLPNPSAPGGGQGAGGGGSLIFEEPGAEGGGELSGDTLVDIVKGATGGDEAWGEGTGIEPHRGQLLVTNTREVHKKIAEVLDNLRRNQGLFVHIETRFVEIENDALEDVGVDFRGLGGNPGDERALHPGTTSNPFGTPLDMNIDPNRRGGVDAGGTRTDPPWKKPSTLTGANGNPLPGNDNFTWRTQHIFDGTAGALKGARLAGGGGLTLLMTTLDPFQVNAIIRAEGQTSKVRRLTAPRVTASNREKVYVSVITQRAYIADWELISGGTGLVVVEVPDPIIQTFQEGVVLEVRPTVSSDRKFVTLDVRPALATLVGGTISTITVNLGSLNMAGIQVPIGIPQITLEEAFTSVQIPDGGTALLGGFRQIDQHLDENSLPFLDNIPIVNVLFRRRGEVKETRSLVILITAKIISIRDEEAKRFNRQK
jgi:general secretion pathway protein D